jgi:hypothetical protein
LELGTPILLNEETVTTNKQFVAQAISYHLKPNQGWCHDDCVEPIDCESIHSLGPGKRISIGIDKAAIRAKFCDGTAGFNSSDNITMRVLLVLD